jgi:fibronectin type 3 domain-containing protein
MHGFSSDSRTHRIILAARLMWLLALMPGLADAAIVTDTFNRANGGLGANWTRNVGESGTLQIVSNQVQPALETVGESLYTASAFGAAQFSEVQYVSGLAGGVINLDVRARQYTTTGTADMYRGQLNGLSGQWRILRLDNGVETQLTSGTLTYANGDTFYFEANGSTLTLKRNGVTLNGTVTDATYPTGDTGVGVYNHISVLIDNWRGGDIATDTTPPTQPTNLAAAVISSSQISLSWTTSTDTGGSGVAGYRVERCTPAACSVFNQIGTPTVTGYSDSGLLANTVYRYQVRAIDVAGNLGSYSTIVSATTLAASGNIVTDTFNRANGGLGANWTRNVGEAGTLQIVSNQVQPAVGTYGESLYTASAFGGAQFSEVQYVSGLAGGVINLDVRARQYTTAGTADMYRGQLNGLTGQWRILRLDNGVETPLASGTLTTANGDTFYFEANGSILVLKRNGVTLNGAVTDTTYTAGNTGVGTYNQVSVLIDNWRGGDISGDTQAPTAPTAPAAGVVSSSAINVSWTASTDNVGVTGYRVERCSGASCTNFVEVGTPPVSPFGDTGLTASTTYRYQIRATDAAGNFSAYSTIVNATTSAGGDTTPPSAPAGLVPTVISSTQINLTWTASTDNVGVAGYQLERCTPSVCTPAAPAIATPTVNSYSNTGLTASTGYSYRVRAFDAANNLSAYSSVVSATTSGDTTPPTAPSGLLAIAGSGTQINLSWTASTDNVAVTGYNLERCQGAGCTAFLQVATPASTTYSDTGLNPSTVYLYRVRARDAANNLSVYSGTATATTQAAPSEPLALSATPISQFQINLLWTTPTNALNLTGYQLERCTGAGCTGFALIASPAATAFNDTGLGSGTVYRYRVRAVNASGNAGNYSFIATATTNTGVCGL